MGARERPRGVGGDSYIHAPKPGDVVREATGVAYFTCAVRYR